MKKPIASLLLLLLLTLGFGEPALASCSSDCHVAWAGCRARAWQKYFDCISRNTEESICQYRFDWDLLNCELELLDCLLGCI